MATTCTLFSVAEADLHAPTDATLPSDEDTSKQPVVGKPHLLELGTDWEPLHLVLAGPSAPSTLGFLVAGGAPVPALEDGPRSRGRHFAPAATVKLLAAVARITEEDIVRRVARDRVTDLSVVELTRVLRRVRVFLAEAVEGDRGVIVHQMSV